MILRFIDKKEKVALAFNTKLEIYTMDYDFVSNGDCMEVSRAIIHHILEEIYFNGWNYSKDLSPVVDDSLKEYGIDEEKFKELNCSAGTIIAIVNSYPQVEAELQKEFISHDKEG